MVSVLTNLPVTHTWSSERPFNMGVFIFTRKLKLRKAQQLAHTYISILKLFSNLLFLTYKINNLATYSIDQALGKQKLSSIAGGNTKCPNSFEGKRGNI